MTEYAYEYIFHDIICNRLTERNFDVSSSAFSVCISHILQRTVTYKKDFII